MNKIGQDYVNKHLNLPYTIKDSAIYERMMRCGIEARRFEATTEEEIKNIAIASLKEDYDKKKQEWSSFVLTSKAKRATINSSK